ncbi:replicative DNA helicase [Nostocoides veronense]|uniref:replicative DNA helicase n=1 Tax=Nostocoides veronense TaxID=330836 RepID=UPI0031E2B7F5
MHAEQSVIGSMMLSKDAIGDVAEVLRSADFYRPAHELIHDAIIDLFGRGEPVDAITVADEMTKRGTLQRVGGQAYLHELIQAVPTAANAGYYAEIVAERALLRRLVEAGTRIVQLGYGQGEGDVDEIVNRAQAEVYAVADKRGTEDYVRLGDTLEATLNEVEIAGGRTDEMTGVPTGFTELDELLHGLHKGQMIVVAARPAVGKALALDTPLPTPTGWTTMGEVAVGDWLLDAAGRPTRVTQATDVMLGRPCFEVEFSDGARLIADANHQWAVEGRGVLTTTQLAAAPAGSLAIGLAAPLDLPVIDLPISPYAVGVLAMGGPGRDRETQMRLEALMGDVDQVEGAVAGSIPVAYLRSGHAQRQELLAGILDVAGVAGADGSVTVSCESPALVADVLELLASLGHAARRIDAAVVFASDQEVFHNHAKALAHKEVRQPVTAARRVTVVRSVESVPVRCVEVDNADHLYLAGREMVPTHNSTFGMDIARAAAIKHGMPAAFFSLEMSRTEISMRVLSAEGSLSLQDLRKGTVGDQGWQKLAKVVSRIEKAPLFIDDSPNMSLMEIRAKCRRLKTQHGLKLVVIDYLQLMSSGKKVESRQQEVSEFSRALKLLAKELEVPVIAISQLNRGPEQRTDKRPQMSDLRESGSIEQDADVVILLHKDKEREGEADVLVVKHRNGPTKDLVLGFQGHYARFSNMAASSSF